MKITTRDVRILAPYGAKGLDAIGAVRRANKNGVRLLSVREYEKLERASEFDRFKDCVPFHTGNACALTGIGKSLRQANTLVPGGEYVLYEGDSSRSGVWRMRVPDEVLKKFGFTRDTPSLLVSIEHGYTPGKDGDSRPTYTIKPSRDGYGCEIVINDIDRMFVAQFPEKRGWYLRDNPQRLPIGEKSGPENPDAGYFDWQDSYGVVGLVSCGTQHTFPNLDRGIRIGEKYKSEEYGVLGVQETSPEGNTQFMFDHDVAERIRVIANAAWGKKHDLKQAGMKLPPEIAELVELARHL